MSDRGVHYQLLLVVLRQFDNSKFAHLHISLDNHVLYADVKEELIVLLQLNGYLDGYVCVE